MSKELLPLVSIIIPIYNGENYMRKAIDSALSQTYSNTEVIIINDGSTDSTDEIARSYGDMVRYFSKLNGGVVSALNFGIDVMEGEYFSWLSHDDWWMPEKIEKQVETLLRNDTSKPMFCVCNCTFIDDRTGEVELKTYCTLPPSRLLKCSLLLGGISFHGGMVLIPKDLFNKCGRFSHSLACHEYDLWLRLIEVADIVVTPEHLAFYRLHDNQVTKQKQKEVEEEIEEFLSYHVKSLSSCEINAYKLYSLRNYPSRFTQGIRRHGLVGFGKIFLQRLKKKLITNRNSKREMQK